ncbi:MAG TPA: TrmJ/YjtD family RNA methyltransferase [Drouetiella sp.]|jgi:TrmH family RNA methyltransferase
MKQTTKRINPEDIYFILVRPNFLGNIGAIARLCKNFGFTKLRLVNAPKNYKDAEARKMSVGAFEILKAAETFESLSEALGDINFVVGTTAGQQRTQELMPLPLAIERIRACSGNKIGILLGDERNGLTNEEMSLCNVLAWIETEKSFPSMNVAQAACVIAYELSRPGVSDCSSAHAAKVESNALPTGKATDDLFEQIGKLLDNIEFSRTFNKTVVTRELRRIYYKAAPTKRESELLLGVMHKMNQALSAAEIKKCRSED